MGRATKGAGGQRHGALRGTKQTDRSGNDAMNILTHNEVASATGEVLLAVSTSKVTTTVENLADALIRYHDHTRFANEASCDVSRLVDAIRIEMSAKD